MLPYDVRITPRWALGEVIKEGRPPTPPSYDELVDDALIASAEAPDQWFTSAEQLTAEWLRSRSLDVRSVRRRDGLHLKTPDMVAAAFGVPIETKRAVGTTNAIVQRIRSARWQARHVVIDLRGAKVSRTITDAGLHTALRLYGHHLDEVVLIVSDDLGVGWSHG